MIPQEVRTLLARLESAGHQAWAVGGCVRDTLRRAAPSDWDVTTDARPEQVMSLFGQAAIPTGLKHGTVTVCAGETRVEVTTFRRDGTYSDHRRPDAVRFSTSLEEDLARRDLTVNAMAMDLRGHICDPFGGQEDLSHRVLRCVGEPIRRLDEDALRIMRTLRFASALGFTVEAHTAAALHRRAPLLRDIAAERLLSETDRLLCGAHVLPVLLAYPDVLGVFLPELLPCVGLDQRNRHHLYDVWEHTARSVAAIAPEPVLRWAMLLHDVGKPAALQATGCMYTHDRLGADIARGILERLRYPSAVIRDVTALIRNHMFDLRTEAKENTIRLWLQEMGIERSRQLIALRRADVHGSGRIEGPVESADRWERILESMIAAGAPFEERQLAVTGADIAKALGIPPSPAIGRIKEGLLRHCAKRPEDNNKTVLLRLSRDLVNNS